MPTEVIMPKVDMDMASGKIMSWHVAEGEAVVKGDPLFDIETDKAAMEVEAPADGILHHTAAEGTEIPIGTPCAWLYAEDEEVGEQPAPFARMGGAEASDDTTKANIEEESADAQASNQETRVEERVSASDIPTNDKPRATPRARSLAAEGGLDLAGIDGSGPRGRVQAGDVIETLKMQAATATRDLAPTSFRPETGALSITRSKTGTGTPIVLIHGFASDATSWAPIEAHIKDRPLIRIDLPGHGKSPKLQLDRFAHLVKEVRRAVDGLSLDKLHLVGHSLGGAVSLALADTRPRTIASLTLIAPAGLGPEIDGDALAGICKANRPESLGPWLKTLVANEDIITDSYVRLVMGGRSEANLRAAQSVMADVMFPDGVQAFDLRATLDRIEAPTRIIWGKRDRIIPWKHALRSPGRIGLHLFEGIGHMPQIECVDAVGAIIRAQIR